MAGTEHNLYTAYDELNDAGVEAFYDRQRELTHEAGGMCTAAAFAEEATTSTTETEQQGEY